MKGDVLKLLLSNIILGNVILNNIRVKNTLSIAIASNYVQKNNILKYSCIFNMYYYPKTFSWLCYLFIF